jgi:hypothetical protein
MCDGLAMVRARRCQVRVGRALEQNVLIVDRSGSIAFVVAVEKRGQFPFETHYTSPAVDALPSCDLETFKDRLDSADRVLGCLFWGHVLLRDISFRLAPDLLG